MLKVQVFLSAGSVTVQKVGLMCYWDRQSVVRTREIFRKIKSFNHNVSFEKITAIRGNEESVL